MLGSELLNWLSVKLLNFYMGDREKTGSTNRYVDYIYVSMGILFRLFFVLFQTKFGIQELCISKAVSLVIFMW